MSVNMMTYKAEEADLAKQEAKVVEAAADAHTTPGTVDDIKAHKASMEGNTYVPGIGQVDVRPGSAVGGEDDDLPTEEEMHTLRRVSGHINWAAYSVAICELAERFSYYGSSVLYTNFVVQPLPDGSNTGAGFEGQSGALGLGSRAGQGISLTNQFFAYLVPLLG